MKAIWQRESDNGYCELVAQTGEYDAFPPVGSLIVDHVPRLVNNDRLAVAFTLAFLPFICGSLELDHGTSPEMADALVDLLDPVNVVVNPVDFVPRKYTYGNNIFSLNIDGMYEVSKAWRDFSDPRIFELNLTQMSEHFSSTFIADVLSVPTNAHLLVDSQTRSPFAIAPFLSVAVLLAEDFDIGGLRVPESTVTNEEASKLRKLLQTCGITLELV